MKLSQSSSLSTVESVAISLCVIVIAAATFILSTTIHIDPVYSPWVVGHLAWNMQDKIFDLIVGPAVLLACCLGGALFLYPLRKSIVDSHGAPYQD
jgi:hypothetical protein